MQTFYRRLHTHQFELAFCNKVGISTERRVIGAGAKYFPPSYPYYSWVDFFFTESYGQGYYQFGFQQTRQPSTLPLIVILKTQTPRPILLLPLPSDSPGLLALQRAAPPKIDEEPLSQASRIGITSYR
jgi:hypothetical protein